jgi:thiosulfate dehydrogenase
MNINFRMVLAYVLSVTVQLCFASIVTAADYDSANLKKGAQLYDKWMEVKKKNLTDNHPLYPASGKVKGEDTWRCKECHGWDYLGKDGRYKDGSHYTGIIGVMEVKDKTPEALFSSLSSGKHDFSKQLEKSDLWDLVKFIKSGLADAESSINSGDVAKGKEHYTKNCATCHGDDGNKLDVKKKKDGIQGVGWLAKDNPQESLHKIRWGHPGSPMPSGIMDQKLTEKDVADIYAFAKTLP